MALRKKTEALVRNVELAINRNAGKPDATIGAVDMLAMCDELAYWTDPGVSPLVVKIRAMAASGVRQFDVALAKDLIARLRGDIDPMADVVLPESEDEEVEVRRAKNLQRIQKKQAAKPPVESDGPEPDETPDDTEAGKAKRR